jgi:hypothetical protein
VSEAPRAVGNFAISEELPLPTKRSVGGSGLGPRVHGYVGMGDRPPDAGGDFWCHSARKFITS